MNYQNIKDKRAITDMGSALMFIDQNATENAQGLYSLFMPVTSLPASGASPEQSETTVTTSAVKTYAKGRQDTPQKEYGFYMHRDNILRLKKYTGKTLSFMEVMPDFTGYKFTGEISFYRDEVSLNSNINGKLVITVSDRDEEPIANCFNLIRKSCQFVSEIPDIVNLATESFKLNIDAEEADVTVEVEAGAGITAAIATKVLTISRNPDGEVSTGSAIVTLAAKKTGYAGWETTINVIY